FEAVQAELRAAENNVETLRAAQYRAGDDLHEKQGAFYAANAEVTRLEQQLQFARESEGRLSQQVAQVGELLSGLTGQIAALGGLRDAVQALQESQRSASDAWEQASRTLADREARSAALAALQAKIGRGKDADEWLAARHLEGARRLWQQLDIERGWEDALEA